MHATVVSSASSAAPTPSARPSPRAPTTRTKTNGREGSSNGTPAAPLIVPGVYSTAPLSSRKAQPLDLNSVERKMPAAKEAPKRRRPHGLQDAPTYCPTPEQWKDGPMAFIRTIAEEGKKFGIVKIVPPDNWVPDFGVDTERFHFRTRRQELNTVEGGSRANLNYLDQLQRFHNARGTPLKRFPSVDKTPLDLFKLKKAVEIRGGFDYCCKNKKWAEIGRDLGYSGKIMSSLSTSLKNSYSRYLHPYEVYLKDAKPIVQRELEAEQGGKTPSPMGTPLKLFSPSVNMSVSAGPDSPGIRMASSALVTAVNTPDAPDIEMIDVINTPIPSGTPNGFTPIRASSGFTPVNSGPMEFTPLNGVKREVDYGLASSRRTLFTTSTSNTPEVNGVFEHAKRPRPVSISNGTPTPTPTPAERTNGEDTENGERRSKRLKKEPAPMVAGSHMSLHRPSPSSQRSLSDRSERKRNKPGEQCEKCFRGSDSDKLLLCEGCDLGYHIFCLQPPLKEVPQLDWYCDRCLVGTGEYGFADGEIYSLRQFQEKANQFRDRHFSPKIGLNFDPARDTKRQPTEEEVEEEFWRLVEDLNDTVEVEYGADIHSTTHGSGFPTVERHPTNPYSTDPWNLTVLPLHEESLFRHIKSDVSGMTVPWLYVGMCFSTFCWHNEDHFTYSANYQHFGSTKTWYGIPGEDADKFEDAMREAVPELFESQPDLLFQLVTLLTPEHLAKVGVRVYAIDQRAGQFVITFPQAYHAGFNHGFNFNEAVNFAPEDWEPHGQLGIEKYQTFRRAPVFSHDELLLTAASKDFTIKTAQWLAPALMRTEEKELTRRQLVLQANPDMQTEIVDEDTELPEDEYQCSACKSYCYLSQVICNCTTNIACLDHWNEICDCDGTQLILRLRMPDETLKGIVQRVRDKAEQPMAWVKKLDSLIDGGKPPQLKAMKSLLNEGEKIACYIPELAPLKAFVERCQNWVEEALPYVSRKSQNRRKNEKVWRKGSQRANEMEEREREHRKPENMLSLLKDASELGFECPELEQLVDKARRVREFEVEGRAALTSPGKLSLVEYQELVETGRSFNIDLPETELLDKIVKQMKWVDDVRAMRAKPMSLDDVAKAIKEGSSLGLGPEDEQLMSLRQSEDAGKLWESKARELMAAPMIHFPQLESLSAQASSIPVSRETLEAVDKILDRQREVQKTITTLYEGSRNADFEKRPRYRDVKEVMDNCADMNSKPTGTIDLEKEQKRHEDWMRRGKKMFGKSNAPLHILHQHMKHVESRNEHCFALEDRPRTPVEPSSREPSPDNDDGGYSRTTMSEENGFPERTSREIFCICRQSEAGMMIECEVCHEWYHGKCLKIARGKVKEDDKYTCPICDYRVKIPRDAARPKLEDLLDWQHDMFNLPFIPDEMDTLSRIIEQATDFRSHVRPFMRPLALTSAELPQMRFYLRKIEGAEILLTDETNFFRTNLHKWMPIAPNPPPMIQASMSTRKPRPTKAQKVMKEMGITDPEQLPPQYRKSSAPKSKRPDGDSLTPSRPYDYGNGHSRYSDTASPVPYGFASTSSQALQSPIAVHQRPQQLDPALFNPPSFPSGIPPSISQNGDSNHYGMPSSSQENNMFETLTNEDAFKEHAQPQMQYDAILSAVHGDAEPQARSMPYDAMLRGDAEEPGQRSRYENLAAQVLDNSSRGASEDAGNLANQFLNSEP